jgi:hypothetical protein
MCTQSATVPGHGLKFDLKKTKGAWFGGVYHEESGINTMLSFLFYVKNPGMEKIRISIEVVLTTLIKVVTITIIFELTTIRGAGKTTLYMWNVLPKGCCLFSFP